MTTQREPDMVGGWVGWRLRALMAVALGGCLLIFGLLRWLAATPYLPFPTALPAPTESVQTLVNAVGTRFLATPELTAPSPRWQVRDEDRAQQIELHRFIAQSASSPATPVRWTGADGVRHYLAAGPRGMVGVSWAFWPLAGLALLLLLVGAVVALSRPSVFNALILLIAACQSGNLLFAAAFSTPGLGLPVALVALDMPLRMAFDLVSGAAALHALALHPVRLARWRALRAVAWSGATLLVALALAGQLPQLWWWLQGTALVVCGVAFAMMALAQRHGPQPVAALINRFVVLIALASLGLSLALMLAASGSLSGALASAVVLIWQVGLAALLLIAPFIARSRQLMREFAFLAGISTVAASLDLLFVAVFSLGAFTSLALVVFIALGVYAGARQWLFDRLIGSNVLTAERIFNQLYRAAREVQARPDQHVAQLANVLRELFEPLEVVRSSKALMRAQVACGGATLLVPFQSVRAGDEADAVPSSSALVLRFARRGKRIFTKEDARLADRVVEQLRRAVAYDLAVERGRNEERQRIAQDLHDDIGARLLTLMYQAPDPAMEDYVRHTLKDLKTLTRGLAASEHRLSHAVAEWKADIGQRLTAARVELDWSADIEADGQLSMVQWSALTRVLRELVSNTIHHGHATQVWVRLVVNRSGLHLVVADDGVGSDPQAWSHGLGLGGVRKRVKLLGGEVDWRARTPCGVECEVRAAAFALKA